MSASVSGMIVQEVPVTSPVKGVTDCPARAQFTFLVGRPGFIPAPLVLSLGFFAQSGQSQLLWPGFWQEKHFTLPEDFLSSLNMVNAVSMRRQATSTNSSVVVTDELDTSPHSTSQEQLKIVPGRTQHTSIQALSTLLIML